MIAANYRFHGHNSLRYVYSNGKAIRSQALTLKFVANARRRNSRLAVVVSKKVLKSAIGRNRIRRRLYEQLRLRLPDFPASYDVVLIVTSSDFRTMPASELAEIVDQMLIKAELMV